MNKRLTLVVAAIALLSMAGIAQAITIDTVPVGNPGKPGSCPATAAAATVPTAIVGAVGYTYNIGKYEVTAGQYTAFLNAVAKTDTYGLYNTNMGVRYHGLRAARSSGAARRAATPTAWPPTGPTVR